MAKHRVFNADRFLDKFQGREDLLREFIKAWDGKLNLDIDKLDVPVFKEFLVNGDGEAKGEMMEALYRAFDLASERGHEDIVEACRESGYEPDADGKLPVECLALKVYAENEEAFGLAYDRHTLWNAERFSVFRGKEARPITDPPAAAARFGAQLAVFFKEDKSSDLVIVRQYAEGTYTNFIVYHEKRTKAELVFKGTKTRPKIAPTVLRPAQQDFVSYDNVTGQVEVEARFEKDEESLRKYFAACCLGDGDFFEAPEAGARFDIGKTVAEDFSLPVPEGHTAALVELHFRLKQKHGPSFVLRSSNVLETLELNHLRTRIDGQSIRRAVFKITFPDDRRGKRVEISGSNRVKFKRATHAEEVFQFLKDWEIAL